jgi:oxidoreductase AflY
LEQLGEPAPDFPIAKEDVIKIAHMAMDSIEMAFDETERVKMPDHVAESVVKWMVVVDNMTRWVFYGGLEKAWDFVPDLEIIRA